MIPDRITFTSEITVRPIQSMGGDSLVVAAAKVSTTGEEALYWADKECPGLINYLMKNRHGTPFEHAAMTFFVHAPAFVWWEWVRHRIGQTVDCDEMSFNLESGRYRQLKPVFWIPRPDRKMKPAPGHKPAHPSYEAVSQYDHDSVVGLMQDAYRAAWERYELLIASRLANEVARAVLGFGVYYSGWVTLNPRSLMHFLSLRTHEPTAKFPSRPQAEIEEAARAVEDVFAKGWPVTYDAFNRHGRVAP
jgi:thymidylate synthase (FAD)